MDQNNLAELFSLTTEIRRKNALVMSLKLKEYDITHEQWFVLRTIENTDFSTQKTIAKLTNKSKSTLTRILDQLEQKDLIKRHINNKDRRSIVLVETDKGKTLVQQILPIENEIRGRIRNGISEEELIHTKNVFMKLLENIEEIRRDITGK